MIKSESEEFWNRFNDWRKKQGYTTADVEQGCGWYSGKCREYKSLGRVLSTTDLSTLRKRYGVSYAYLIDGDSEDRIVDPDMVDLVYKFRNATEEVQFIVRKLLNKQSL